MKEFISLNQLFERVKNRKIFTWIDKLNFLHILVIWILIIIIFGIFYYLFNNNGSYLSYTQNGNSVNSIINSIYFSFIAAMTTGFGDILPVGYFKILAIFEVIFGLLLLALVTSKLVSIKQDMILNEIYELSLNERVNRLRSSLLLFRQNLGKIIARIEEGYVRKREISDLYVYVSSLEDTLHEIDNIMQRQDKNHFTKKIDAISTEIIFNSVLSSFEKLNELLTTLNQHKLEWKREIITDLVNRCMSLNERVFVSVVSSKNLREKTLNDLRDSKNKITELIKTSLG